MGQTAPALAVGEPTSYYVSSLPPEPLFEQMSGSPGNGYVWIDGYWHWSGDEWVWVQGRWERNQVGYVYVAPSYDYVDDRFVYTPGYWSQRERAPHGWAIRDQRDGRPTIAAPPPIGSGGERTPLLGDHGPAAHPAILSENPGVPRPVQPGIGRPVRPDIGPRPYPGVGRGRNPPAGAAALPPGGWRTGGPAAGAARPTTPIRAGGSLPGVSPAPAPSSAPPPSRGSVRSPR